VQSADLLLLPLSALWQQKSRTVLTTLGVVFGSFVLAASLSVGQGVQDLIERESHRSDFLRQISVFPGNPPGQSDKPPEAIAVNGEMSEPRRDRLRRAVKEHRDRWTRFTKPAGLLLTREKLNELAALPHVRDVAPQNFWLNGHVLFNQRDESADLQAARVEDSFFRKRLVAGRPFESPHEQSVLVSEFLLYRLGLVDEAAVGNALGKRLRLEIQAAQGKTGFFIQLVKANGSVQTTREEDAVLDQIRQSLPKALDKLGLAPAQIKLLRSAFGRETQWKSATIAEEYEIVGVYRLATDDERHPPWEYRQDTDLVLPVETALDLYYRIPFGADHGLDGAVVRVDDEKQTKAVYQRIKDMGWTARAPLEFVEQQRLQYLLIFGGMTCVAVVALLVAALGIANTMVMSVLERTREIGIMKAVGASGAQLQSVFVLEGALIGLIGGGFGLLLAWGACQLGDAWIRSLASGTVGVKLTEAIFVFPTWLFLAVLGFALVVTTLAAIYPARRAARIDPVIALRHE
jgi:putative ABC transport system permease protein